MARQTRFATKLHELREEIDSKTPPGRKGDARRKELLGDLFALVAGGPRSERLLRLSRHGAAVARKIERHVKRDRGDSPAKAIAEYERYGASRAHVLRRWKIRSSEWDALLRLAAQAGRPLVRDRGEPNDASWLSSVAEAHEKVTVWVCERALQDMALGALEAYSVPRGKGSSYSEVYGLAFGSIKRTERRAKMVGLMKDFTVYVERVVLQLRAKSTGGWILRDPRSEEVHLKMAAELFPHLELVGDFHSHPYRSHNQLLTTKGWTYTQSDENDNRTWFNQVREMGHAPRVSCILAIARAAQVKRTVHRRANLLKSTVGRCHLYLAAYRILADGSFSGRRIDLNCPQLMRWFD